MSLREGIEANRGRGSEVETASLPHAIAGLAEATLGSVVVHAGAAQAHGAARSYAEPTPGAATPDAPVNAVAILSTGVLTVAALGGIGVQGDVGEGCRATGDADPAPDTAASHTARQVGSAAIAAEGLVVLDRAAFHVERAARVDAAACCGVAIKGPGVALAPLGDVVLHGHAVQGQCPLVI